MKCPFCAALQTQVRDSRSADDDNAVKRRRFCEACGGRFTTFERVQFRDLIVVKSDGSRQAFDRGKLTRAIAIATRKRNVDADIIERWVNRIVDDIEKSADPEVSSRTIGRLVMDNLFEIDPVAYVRFASVYENFQTTGDFAKVIKAISSRSKAKYGKKAVEAKKDL